MPIQIGKRPDHDFDAPLGLLSDCHRRIEHFLRVLVALVERGATLDESGRRDLDGALKYFATSAPLHTADEEESLFPRLRQSKDEAALHALTTMDRLERDHQDAALHHAAVDRIGRQWLAGGALPDEELQTLRSHLKRLQELYRAHISIEDRELFPAAARALPAETLAAVGREMAARRRPR